MRFDRYAHAVWHGCAALLLTLAAMVPAQAQAQDRTFSDGQIDALMAPIALYPDALLAQVLMATTYPADVAAAGAWVKAHPDDKGDAAVNKVESQNWDPSVKGLVSVPQVIVMMNEKPQWVQDTGDAFLEDPKRVMASVQRLRTQAQKAGNLKTTSEQKVATETQSGSQVIIIEPAQPQTIYVPVYQPTVVYGSWMYPAYPPYYWAPPPYYYPGANFAAGVIWGAAVVGVANGIWGNANWGRGDVDINVNRYNNVNVNNKINNASGNRSSWNHDASNRKGAPYGNASTRDKYSRPVAKDGGVSDARGHADSRDAQRDRARDTMAGTTKDPATREALQKQGADRAGDRTGDRAGDKVPDRAGDRAGGGAGAGSRDMPSRDAAASRPAPSTRDTAFSGAGNPAASKADYNRGQASRQSMDRPTPSYNKPAPSYNKPAPSYNKPAARPAAPAARPAGGGGGGRAGGGRR
jgi:hypothetical protein